MTFSGVLTALVTPFRDGAVDETAFRAMVRRQLDAGIVGLVPCGTTGEAATLSADEQAAVIRWTVEEAAGAVPVLAGVGSCTRTVVENSVRAASAGAQGLLVTAPTAQPTQELFRHFKAVAEAQPGLEVCVYDVPGRTGVKISPETIERLAAIDNITCVKDATVTLPMQRRSDAAWGMNWRSCPETISRRCPTSWSGRGCHLGRIESHAGTHGGDGGGCPGRSRVA